MKKSTGGSAAYMRGMREKIVSRKKKRPKEAYVAPQGIRTRFSRSANGNAPKHSRDMIRLEVTKLHGQGLGNHAIGRLLGLPPTTVENWTTQTTLPKKPTSPYTFARMLVCVTLARNLYRQKFSDNPRHCLIEAVKRTPTMKWTSVDVYLSLEAVPSLPGFPLYADQAVQARCEQLARGERTRGTDIFDAAPVPAPAPAPSQPASGPVVRSPVVDRERFLLSRNRLQLPRLRL